MIIGFGSDSLISDRFSLFAHCLQLGMESFTPNERLENRLKVSRRAMQAYFRAGQSAVAGNTSL